MKRKEINRPEGKKIWNVGVRGGGVRELVDPWDEAQSTVLWGEAREVNHTEVTPRSTTSAHH